MIVMYTSDGCRSCMKAKQYMKDNNLKFVEKKLSGSSLNEEEVRYLLKRSENGSDDLISPRSKLFKELGSSLDSMSFNDLVRFICVNPTILKRPIIIDDKNMQTGYDEDEITVFRKNKKDLCMAL